VVLALGFPDVLWLVKRVVDDLIQWRGFRLASFVVLELFLLALPCVSPEHRRQNREKAVDSFLGESERDSHMRAAVSLVQLDRRVNLITRASESNPQVEPPVLDASFHEISWLDFQQLIEVQQIFQFGNILSEIGTSLPELVHLGVEDSDISKPINNAPFGLVATFDCNRSVRCAVTVDWLHLCRLRYKLARQLTQAIFKTHSRCTVLGFYPKKHS
jgi:hypothetical protein